MGKVLVQVEVVMDRVRSNEMQTLDTSPEELSLTINQLGNVIKSLRKEYDEKMREKAKTEDAPIRVW